MDLDPDLARYQVDPKSMDQQSIRLDPDPVGFDPAAAKVGSRSNVRSGSGKI